MQDNVDEADLERVEAEEEVISFPKDFAVEPIEPDLVWRAKTALFDTRLDDVEALVRGQAASNPWAQSLHAEAALWRFIYERKPEDFEAALLRLKTSVAMATVLIKRNKSRADKKTLAKNPAMVHAFLEAQAMEAQALLYISTLHLMQKSFLRGAYYIRKSWKCWESTFKLFKELDATDDHKPDDAMRGLVQFGVGFFFFFISLVPSNLQFIVKLLGFSGDRMKALSLLVDVQTLESSGKSVESSIILFVLFYWFMDERDKAPAVLDRLKERLPNSPIIFLADGWASLVTAHDIDHAIACYKQASEMTQLEQLKVACRAQLAYAHFLREDWQQVIEHFSYYMEHTKTTETKCYSAFALAVANYMVNETAKCADWMRKCIEFEDKTSNWDAYSVSVAREYLANKNDFDKVSLWFLLMDNAIESGNPDRALEYGDKIEAHKKWQEFSEDDKTALLCYFRGCAWRMKKDVSKAKSQLIRVAGFHSRPLALEARRAVPYSLVVLGEISMQELGQLDAAERFYKKAEGYKEKYLFQDALQFRLQSDTQILESKRKKKTSATPE